MCEVFLRAPEQSNLIANEFAGGISALSELTSVVTELLNKHFPKGE